MEKSYVRDFYEKVYGNSETKNKFLAKLNLATSEENLKEVLETEIIPFAKSLGYEFTCEQFLSYANEQKSMIDDGILLDDEFLENVVGGVGGFQKFAATLSLAIVGLGVMAPAVSASAAAASNATAAPQTQIVYSIENEMKDSHEEKNVEADSQTDGGFGTFATANLIFDANLSQLDLLEGNNLNKALQGAVSALLNLTAEDNVGGKYDHFKEALSNVKVVNALININDCLKDNSISETTKQAKSISHLSTIKTALEESNLKGNLLYNFADGMLSEYKVNVARQTADEIMEKYRADIEKKMGSESASASVGANTNVNVDGVEVEVGFEVGFQEGSSETSFYETSTGFSVNLSTGLAAVGIASADVSANLEITRTLIYQSLEQFLDTNFSQGNISSLKLRVPSLNEVADARSQMQNQERDALSKLKTSAEPLLKVLGVISQNTSVALHNVTKTRSADRQTSVTASANLEGQLGNDKQFAIALGGAGINLSGEVGASVGVGSTSVQHSYMELIGDSCSPDFGASSEELAEFLNANSFHKFKEIKGLLEKGASEAEVLSIAKTIAGSLKAYNHSLSVMADENATKEDKTKAESKKHDMEKDWLSTFHTGRLNMLKAGIAIATTLRTQESVSDSAETQKAFNELRTELDNLSKMQEFTNSLRSSKQSAEFSTTHTESSKSINFAGSIALSIPGAGESSINISNENVKSQFDEHSTHDITIDVKLPVIGNNIVGQAALQKAMASVQNKLLESGNEDAANIANALKLMTSQFGVASNAAGYTLSEAVSTANKLAGDTVAGVNKYVTLSFRLTNVQANNEADDTVALPGTGNQAIKRDSSTWKLKYVKSTESRALKVGVGGVEGSATLKRATNVIGSDSLEFSANKFNVFAQTMNDSNHKKDISPLWTNFKSGQATQFKKIFKNMAQSDSNVRYDLQGLYNEILQESGNSKSVKKAVDNAFKDFLEACDNFASDSSEKNFEKASAAFDKVLKMNFEHNYMAGFNALHGQLKK